MKWNEWRIKEISLSCSKREVQLWPNTVQWDPISKFLLHTQIKCTHNRIHHTDEEECDYLWSREGESPSWINPCLRVLVPSLVGLDSTHSLIFCSPPFWMNTTASSQIIRCPFFWSKDELLNHFKQKLYFPSLPHNVPLLFYAFSIFCISFFLLATAAVVFYESGGFFLPGFL